jgi:hypothetical protein
MAVINTIQSIGNFSITLTHTLINTGTAVSLRGAKIEGDIINTTQQVMNSKIIPLIGGDTITLTNSVKCGKLTISATNGSGLVSNGDLVAICRQLQGTADSSGGTITVSWPQDGKTQSVVFAGCTLESFEPLKIQGNDVPTYSCNFNYASYIWG